MRSTFCAAACLCFFAWSAPAFACTVPPSVFEPRTQGSDGVLLGQITRRVINRGWMEVDVRIERVLLGQSTATTYRLVWEAKPGPGSCGRGGPDLRKGDEVVIYVADGRTQAWMSVDQASIRDPRLQKVDARFRLAASRLIISNPEWIRRPTQVQMQQAFPKAASANGGTATIQCSVQANGTLSNCIVAQEAPTGQGFGAAALGLSRLFQMRPFTANGAPVAGATASAPMRFER